MRIKDENSDKPIVIAKQKSNQCSITLFGKIISISRDNDDILIHEKSTLQLDTLHSKNMKITENLIARKLKYQSGC